jgi:enoyl-CoA hydratase
MTETEAPVLVTERRGPVALLVMNRPQALNALSRALRAALTEALTAAEADPGIRAVVLTGAGPRAFSAGLDLKELGADPDALVGDPASAAASDPVLALRRMTKPVVAAVNGVAVTGGFELALACDIRLAAPAARFADTHSRVGVLPGWGLSQILPRLIGPSRAKEVSFAARFVEAEEAAAWGLVNRVVPAEALIDEALALAARIAEAPADWLAACKAVMDRGFEETLAEGLAREAEAAGRWNRAQTPEALAARREAVMARGRAG